MGRHPLGHMTEERCMSLTVIKVEHEESMEAWKMNHHSKCTPNPLCMHRRWEISVFKILKSPLFLKAKIMTFYYRSKKIKLGLDHTLVCFFSVKSGCSFCKAYAPCWGNEARSCWHLLSVTMGYLVSHDWFMRSSNTGEGDLLKNFEG